MNNRRIIIPAVDIAVAVFVLVAGWSWLPILPFHAVYHDGTGQHLLIEHRIDVNDHIQIQDVLKKHREPNRMTKNSILIAPALYFDKELRWNYTSKANLKPQQIGAGNSG